MRLCKHFCGCSQQSVWNYTTKSQIAPRKDLTEIDNESVYGTHLRMLFKMGLSVQMDAKDAQEGDKKDASEGLSEDMPNSVL